MSATTIALDNLDHRLIRLLQENARASYQELAETLGTSGSTVRRRVDRLIENRVLTLVAFPSWKAVGFDFVAFIGLSVDLHHLQEVAEQLAAMDEICFVTITAGIYDIVAQVALPSNEDLVRFATQRIASLPGIRDLQTLMIPQIVKGYNQYRLPIEPAPLYRQEDSCLPAGEVKAVAS